PRSSCRRPHDRARPAVASARAGGPPPLRLRLGAFRPSSERRAPRPLGGTLLALGARTLVASVVPVPDAAARRLTVALHRELVAGASPAAALSRAQTDAPVAGFVCLGRG